MKPLDEILNRLRQEKPFLEETYHVAELGVFGSVSRGDARPDSDVDIVVTFNQPVGFDFIRLGDYLEKILGVRVDLVSKKAIRQEMLSSILEDVRYV